MPRENQQEGVKLPPTQIRVEKEKIYPAYVSKHDSNCEKQVILLMIPSK